MFSIPRCLMASCLFVFGSMAAVPTSLSAQEVRGVTLGKTTVRQVRAIRGAPMTSGRTEDGEASFLRYGEWVFYFDRDSVATFVRYFPTGMMLRSEVEEVFGKVPREFRQPDLTVRAVYADTVSVAYDRSGSVSFIEYSSRSGGSSDSGGLIGGLTPRQIEALGAGYRLRLLSYLWMACTARENLSYASADSLLREVAPDGLDAMEAKRLRIDLRSGGGGTCNSVRNLSVQAAGPN